jgi:hypothetical protein
MDVAIRTTKPETIVALGRTIQGSAVFEIVGLAIRTRKHIDAKERDIASKVLAALGRITFRTLNHSVRHGGERRKEGYSPGEYRPALPGRGK